MIFVNSVATSLNEQLQENIEENLDTIFDTFSDAVFGALGGAISSGSAGVGGDAGGSLLDGVLGFAGNLLGFQRGGVVPGSGPTPAIVHGGEAILNPEQQRRLFRGDGGQSAAQAPNITNINISGNVDQRSIDQIRQIVSSSPMEVGSASRTFMQDTQGLRRR